MQVVQTLKTLKIQTDDSQLFKTARNLIYKNFRSNIGKKSKLISFCDENELVQRRYFCKWLNCLNRKLNHEDLNLEKSFYKAIHLSLLQKEALKSIISAKISFKALNIIISFSSSDELLFTYLKNYFKDHATSINNNDFFITYESERTLELLNSLASSNEHLNRFISFELNELEFLQFKKSLNKNQKSDSRFLMLCSLYEEQFNTLGVEIGASFDELKATYHKLARKYHPDYHAGASAAVLALCAERFNAINKAYLCLKPLYKEHR